MRRQAADDSDEGGGTQVAERRESEQQQQQRRQGGAGRSLHPENVARLLHKEQEQGDSRDVQGVAEPEG